MFLRKKEEGSLRPRKLIPLVKHSHHAAVKRFRTPAESSEKSNFKFLRTMRSYVRVVPGRFIKNEIDSYPQEDGCHFCFCPKKSAGTLPLPLHQVGKDGETRSFNTICGAFSNQTNVLARH